MDNKQLNSMQRFSTLKQKDQIVASYKQDIKTSLEQQKQQNKQKFEEPFFIKLGDEQSVPMKIVKPKTGGGLLSPNSNVNSTEDDKNASLDTPINLNASRGSIRPSKQKTVVEEEDEEESPSTNQVLRVKSPKKPPTKKTLTTDGDDKFEKISDDTFSQIKTLPQLVQVDVNLDTLKNFLEDIQEAINEHAKTMQAMQADLKKKAYERTIGHYFQKISEGLHKECGERPHAFRLDNE